MNLAAFTLERGEFEFRLRLESAEPRLLDQYVTGRALAGAPAKRFNRQSCFPEDFHQGRAVGGIDLVLRAVAIGCGDSGQYSLRLPGQAAVASV